MSIRAAEMRHCVGGYGAECISGQGHIFSIRAQPGDRRIATAEIRIEALKPLHLSLAQLAGPENEDPPQRAFKAVEAYIAAIEKGKVPLNPEAAKRHRSPVRRLQNAASAVAGFDVHDVATRERIWLILRGFSSTASHLLSQDHHQNREIAQLF